MSNNISETRTANGIEYHLDWDCEGHVVMHNAQTVKLYHKLKYDDQPPEGEYFYAFSQEQFNQQMKAKHLEGKKIYRGVYGLYGTNEGIDKLIEYIDGVSKRIKEECNPQEVYFYEYNNHECMIDWDGDLEAIKLIVTYWGADVARTIKRINAGRSLDDILNDKREWD